MSSSHDGSAGQRGGKKVRQRLYPEARPPRGAHTGGMSRESHATPGFSLRRDEDLVSEGLILAGGFAGHGPHLELCRPGIPSTVTTLYDRTWDESTYDANSYAITSEYDVSHGGSRFINIGASTSTQGFPNVSPWGIDETIPVSPGDVVDVYLEAAKRDPGDDDCQIKFRDVSNGVLATHDMKMSGWANATWYALTGQFTAPANTTHMTIEFSAVLDGWYLDRVLITTAGTEATINDGHPDLVGTSRRAARCDHRHDVHRDREPTVDDDWATQGYKLGTIWAQLDNLEAPTAIVGTWMLVDVTEGAAVWLPVSGAAAAVNAVDVAITDSGAYFTGTDVEAALQELGANGAGAPSTADYLVGTATGSLSAEIVVGTSPGGELGGTWAAPTVDAIHSGSAHLALGTTPGTAAEGDHSHGATIGYYRPVMDGLGNVVTDSGTGAALMAYAED